MTRAEYRERELEHELALMKAAYEDEKAAHKIEKLIHAKSKKRISGLKCELHEAKLLRRKDQEDAQHMALAAKMRQNEVEDVADDALVYTDDLSLQISDSRQQDKKQANDCSGQISEHSIGGDVPHKPRLVVCITCYAHRLRCDHGDPCGICQEAGMRCTRAKCKGFEPGQCQRQNCRRAHREDLRTHSNVAEAGHVSRKAGREPPMKRFRDDKDDKSDQGDDDDDKNGGGGAERPIATSR
ncbi:hypothetical protein J1614_008621 [Plenodomus biglobosus]|nr:hypothetical protein J1614_008621 [Plenodomus biglobosus]